MLKNITLGQYFPGKSLIHRLDPRTKLILFILYIVALFLGKGLVTYAILVLFLIVIVVMSKVPPASLLRGLKPLWIVIIITGALNLLFSQGQTVLFTWRRISITLEGCYNAGFMIVRIILLVLCAFMLTYTTSPILLTDGLERLLRPFQKIGLPIHEMAMMMSIALRFIPTLVEETDKIISAQKARGADFESGNVLRRAKALVPILVPLFISAFRRADELAIAMECRCYHGGEGRTRLHQLKYARKDYIAYLIGVVLCVAVGVLGRHFGL